MNDAEARESFRERRLKWEKAKEGKKGVNSQKRYMVSGSLSWLVWLNLNLVQVSSEHKMRRRIFEPPPPLQLKRNMLETSNLAW